MTGAKAAATAALDNVSRNARPHEMGSARA
jgi:hypothetical protein